MGLWDVTGIFLPINDIDIDILLSLVLAGTLPEKTNDINLWAVAVNQAKYVMLEYRIELNG